MLKSLRCFTHMRKTPARLMYPCGLNKYNEATSKCRLTIIRVPMKDNYCTQSLPIRCYIISYFKSLQFYSQQKNAYDELNSRAMMNTRNSLANSVNSQPPVSISSTNVQDASRRKLSSSAQSRRGTAGNVYYSSVPVEDSVLLINNNQDQQQGDYIIPVIINVAMRWSFF